MGDPVTPERLSATEMSAQGGLPVSPPVLGAAVRAVLDVAPGVFAPVAAHPATEQALVAAHELRSVAPGAFDALAGCSGRRPTSCASSEPSSTVSRPTGSTSTTCCWPRPASSETAPIPVR